MMHDDYRRATFRRMYGTVGQAWDRDSQRAIAALVPGQEWSFPEESRPDTRAIADLAVIARIGGNEYRRRIERRANEIRNGKYSASAAEFDRWVRQDAESLAAGRSYRRGSYSEPWKWVDTEGGAHLTPATYHEGAHVMSPRDYAATLPEAAFDWPIYRAGIVPQVYVNVAGGIAEATVTRGDAEVIEHDWDNLRDAGDYTRDDLLAMRSELSRVADSEYRARLLADMDEVIDRYEYDPA